jgi:hypothetical protein
MILDQLVVAHGTDRAVAIANALHLDRNFHDSKAIEAIAIKMLEKVNSPTMQGGGFGRQEINYALSILSSRVSPDINQKIVRLLMPTYEASFFLTDRWADFYLRVCEQLDDMGLAEQLRQFRHRFPGDLPASERKVYEVVVAGLSSTN